MNAAVSKYTDLIELFVSGAIDAPMFESSCLTMFKTESARLPEMAFNALDHLFGDVDAFCADPALRGESDLDENTLRSRSLIALRDLTAVAEQL